MKNSIQQQITPDKWDVRARWTAKKLWVRGESFKELQSFSRCLLSGLAPNGALEYFFAEQIIIASWKILRAQDLERERLNQLNKISDDSHSGWGYENEPSVRRRVRNLDRIKGNDSELLKIQKQIRHLEESLYQAIEKLKEFKKERV